jgi:uncharacterized membrane protein
MLCEYKNIFGLPNEGFHEKRFLSMAAYDLFGTILISILISYVFSYNVIVVFILLMIITILVHRLFCVNTTINKKIFGII